MKISIRKATPSDWPAIDSIFSNAREYMRTHGNPTQWGEHGPGNDKIKRDIDSGNFLVLTDEEGTIHACFALIYGNDHTYFHINGAWKSDEPYATMHRAATDGKLSGCLDAMFSYSSSLYPHLRADTHRNNHGVQEKLLKLGFEYCGIINVDDGTERLAYEWMRKEDASC